QFLNEFGSGQEAEVMKALQREHVERAAPEGKYLVSIKFQIYGMEATDMPPPPPPVSNEYASLGEVTIIAAAAPKSPPPPPVVRPIRKDADTNATNGKERLPEP